MADWPTHAEFEVDGLVVELGINHGGLEEGAKKQERLAC